MFTKLAEALRAIGSVRPNVDILPAGANFQIKSRGLSSAGLPEVEIVECPARLCEVASNLVTAVARNGLNEPASVAAGKVIGGRFVRSDQPVVESFRLENREQDASTLRIVDFQSDSSGFPYRLVATHLCATAGVSKRDALRLLLVAVEVWPQEDVASNAALGDFELNPNNFWSWIDLGSALARAGHGDKAISHWKIGVCMWPRGGKLYASRMLSRGRPNSAWNDNLSRQFDFWASVSDEKIVAWCNELKVELSDSALKG